MTATGEQTVEPVEPDAPDAPRTRGGVLGFFRDPLRVFLLLAIVTGGYLACVVPHFGGIDETAHFYRSYQISEGHFLPQKYGSSGFSGACIPRDVILAQRSDSSVYWDHLVASLDRPKNAAPLPYDPGPLPACPTDHHLGFVTFSTFPSPVPYLPQTAAVFITRELGFSIDVMLIAARFAVLATYVAIVGFAIARAPRSKWALATVALLPVAVFQSAASPSHDAFTTAIALLVVSSALRAVDPPPGTSTRALLIEALGFSAVLGMCKPVYVVIAALYLLPLLGARRRRDRWPLVFAPVLGVLVSVLWNQAVGDLWKTDAGYFGIRVDDVTQKHELLHRPWDFGADLLRSGFHQAWEWTHTLVTVGPSVTHGPAIVAVIALVIYAAASLQRDRTEAPDALAWLQRGLVVLVLLAGVALVAAANYVYWTEPGSTQIAGIQPRYFMPLVALVPVAVGSLPFRWARAERATVPVGVLLTPVLIVFCMIATFHMY